MYDYNSGSDWKGSLTYCVPQPLFGPVKTLAESVQEIIDSVDKTEDKTIAEERNEMSVLLTGYTEKNEFVLTSDSRSSYTQNGCFRYTDNYKKIVYIKKYNIAVASVGANNFFNKTFAEVVETLLSRNSETVDAFITGLKDHFTYCSGYGGSIELIIAGFTLHGLPLLNKTVFANGKIAASESSKRFVMGASLAQNIAVEGKWNDYSVEEYEQMARHIIKYYEEYVAVPCVGGPLQEIVFTRDGLLKSENAVIL